MSDSISTVIGDAANDFGWSDFDTVMELIDYLDELAGKGKTSAQDLYEFILERSIRPKKKRRYPAKKAVKP